MKKCILTFILILTLVFSSITVSFAAPDQDVTIVNPVSYSSITSSNLLISVKITAPKTIRVSAYEVKKTVGDVETSLGESDMKAILDGTFTGTIGYTPVLSPENFTSTNKLSFYTKKLDINPGLYLIKVETIYQNRAVYSSRSYVTIKSKSSAESKLFDSQSGTASAFLQNLIKAIFN
ncbi:MAG: hypothetical protein AB9836_09465 [Aminipila sp.]